MSDGLNRCTFVGNLGRDAESRQTQNGTTVLKFSIGCSERYKKGDEWVDKTEWVNCTLFGRRAEALAAYLVKGTKVLVEAKVRTTSSEKDGVKKYYTEFIVDNLILCGSRPTSRPAETEGGEFNDADYPTGGNNDFPF